MSDHPTTQQYKLAVKIGHLAIDAMASGATFSEVIATLVHCKKLMEFNRDVGFGVAKDRRKISGE